MNESSEHPGGSGITLVDMVVTLYKRKFMFFVIFLLFAIATIVWAISAPANYSFVSVMKVAQTGKDSPLEAPELSLAAFENRWLPQVIAEQKGGNDDLPFDVTFVAQENTGLIRLESLAREQYSEAVDRTHNSIIELFTEHQNELLTRVKAGMQRQIDSLNALEEALSERLASSEAVASVAEKRANIYLNLESISPSDVIVSSRKSMRPIGPPRSFYIGVGLVLGVVMGILAVFVAEFGRAVNERLKKQ